MIEDIKRLIALWDKVAPCYCDRIDQRSYAAGWLLSAHHEAKTKMETYLFRLARNEAFNAGA